MVVDYGSVFAILDKYPVTPGHHLVITKRHVSDYFEMSFIEKGAALAVAQTDPEGQPHCAGVQCLNELR